MLYAMLKHVRVIFALSALVFSFLDMQRGCAFDFDFTMVPQLKKAEWSDKTGLVMRVFKVDVPGVKYPYNPSLINYRNGFLLSFRYDYKPMHAMVGLLQLTDQFKPCGSVRYVANGNGRNEDARLFQANGSLFITYTQVLGYNPLSCCMAATQLNPDTLTVSKDLKLVYGQERMEKNWAPFVVKNESTGIDDVYFMYKYAPQEVSKLTLPLTGEVKRVHENRSQPKVLEWVKKWGEIRGGTPPIKMGSEFLTFFHSSFLSNNIRYYVMGAMTFEGTPPFKITRISKLPIFFKNIYATPVTSNVWFYPRNHLRVLFPSGCVAGVENGKDAFYVVCGENDVTIKCVVIDKDKLIESMIEVQ